MSAAKLILGMLGTDAVKSLVFEVAAGALADFLNAGTASKGSSDNVARSCRRCPWGKNGRVANNGHRSEVIVPGRARVAVPGLQGNPARAAAVEAALLALEGVSVAQANHLTGRALALFEPAVVDLAAIRRAIKESAADPVVPSSAKLELVAAGSLN